MVPSVDGRYEYDDIDEEENSRWRAGRRRGLLFDVLIIDCNCPQRDKVRESLGQA